VGELQRISVLYEAVVNSAETLAIHDQAKAVLDKVQAKLLLAKADLENL